MCGVVGGREVCIGDGPRGKRGVGWSGGPARETFSGRLRERGDGGGIEPGGRRGIVIREGGVLTRRAGPAPAASAT